MSRRKLIAERLVIASHNPGKVKEINALIAPFGVAGVSASALGLPVPEETENSFEGNARLKALAGARGSGLPALADDSGLEVMALGGRPGVHTADWAQTPSGRDFYQAMARVERELQELERDAKKSSPVFCKITRPNKERAQIADSEFLRFALGAKNRAARFVCCLALAWPDGHVETFQGRVEGSLTWPPRGTMGFGFDPVFVPAGEVKTFAELDPETKHAISHRADAFRQLVAACLAG